MEFFNIKSSAALIYDEFIQNAGKYHQWKALLFSCPVAVSFRVKCDRVSSLTDSRTKDWFLMSSPVPQTLVIVAYIYFVTSLGPRIMENRKAFDLKGVLIVYNFSVVALSLYMIYEVSRAQGADVCVCARARLRRTCISCSARPGSSVRRLVSDGARLVKCTEWNFLWFQLMFDTSCSDWLPAAFWHFSLTFFPALIVSWWWWVCGWGRS